MTLRERDRTRSATRSAARRLGLERRDLLRAVAGMPLASALAAVVPSTATAATGEIVWQFPADGSVRSSPTVVNGVAYVGSRDGALYAIETDTGEAAWTFDAGPPVRASPNVVDGVVYFGAQTSIGDNVYAVDADTGEEVWAIGLVRGVRSSPTVDDGLVYVGSDSGTVYALDAESGEEEWVFRTGGQVHSAPTVVDAVVYIGSRDGNLYAVDSESGEPVWDAPFETQGWVDSAPTAVDGLVYVGSRDDHLYAVDADTGEEAWRFETNAAVTSSPTVADGLVVVGSWDGSLYALDAASGRLVWEFDVGFNAAVRSSPTVADGTVFCGADDDHLYGLSLQSGEETMRVETGDSVQSSPTVVDGVAYVGSQDHHLYAIQTDATGWSADSRVGLGTLGHHHDWAGVARPVEITGFHPPKIDGVLYGHTGESLPDGTVGEWAEADRRSIELRSPDGASLSGTQFAKQVARQLHIGLRLPAGDDGLAGVEHVYLQLDTDGSGELSGDDVRLTAESRDVCRPDASPTDPRAVSMTVWTVEVFRDGSFVALDGHAEEAEGLAALMMRPFPDGSEFALEASVDLRQLEALAASRGFDVDIEAGAGWAIELDEPDEEDEDEEGRSGSRFGIDHVPMAALNAGVPEPVQTYQMKSVYDAFQDAYPPTQTAAIDHVEVTQSVQAADNSLPLARGRDTLVRVFVDHDEDDPITVDVSVMARLVDDEGTRYHAGTMSTEFEAQPGPLDRDDIDHSANFHLPAIWLYDPADVSVGEKLNLRVSVDRPGFVAETLDSQERLSLELTETYSPNIFCVRVNEGSAENPAMVPKNRMGWVQKGFQRMMPTRAKFITIASGNLGEFEFGNGWFDDDGDDILAALNELAAWLETTDYPVVDQVFGQTDDVMGGGKADAAFGGGDSLASWGSLNSSSSSLVMAHEINHNIGDDNWARHVGGACGSGGVEDVYTSERTDEVGWDFAEDYMVPSGHAELMSYCMCSGNSPESWCPVQGPIAWTSAYRWKHLVDRWASWSSGSATHPSLQSAPPLARAAAHVPRSVETMRVVTAFVYEDETVALRPSFEVPGQTDLPSRDAEDPQAVLTVEYDGGASREKLPIEVDFEHIEAGISNQKQSVTFTLPDDGAITGLELEHLASGERDGYEDTGFVLESATVDVPASFERDEGYDIGVGVAADADGPLYRKLFYDRGDGNWLPFTGTFTKDTVSARFAEDPGSLGRDGRFVLLVSDGVRTRRHESDAFDVPSRPPAVRIPRARRFEVTYGTGGGGSFEVSTERGDAPRDVPIDDVEAVPVVADATVGSTVSFRVETSDELGHDLPDEMIEWTVVDEDGAAVPVTGCATGSTLVHRFGRPGDYTVAAEGTDPETRLQASDTIAVNVSPPPVPAAETLARFEAGEESTVVQLDLAVDAAVVEVGETVAFTLAGAETGDPLAALLTITDDGDAQVGAVEIDGRAGYAFEQAGTFAIEATKAAVGGTRFEPDTVTVRVEEPGAGDDEGNDGDGGGDDDTEATDEDAGAEGLPGFGPSAAVAGVLGATYVLKRRLTRSDEES